MKEYWRALVSKTAALFRRRRLEAEMAEEMHQHLDALTKVINEILPQPQLLPAEEIGRDSAVI